MYVHLCVNCTVYTVRTLRRALFIVRTLKRELYMVKYTQIQVLVEYMNKYVIQF